MTEFQLLEEALNTYDFELFGSESSSVPIKSSVEELNVKESVETSTFDENIYVHEVSEEEYEVVHHSGIHHDDHHHPLSCTGLEDEEKTANLHENIRTHCEHLNTLEEKSVVLCIDCGEEISKNINFEREWRYYGSSDTKNSSDPSRVQMRKSDDRNIYKDVETMGFSDNIVATANKIYQQVTRGQIKRGNSRKSLVFACIFQSFKIHNKPQSHDELIRMFNLSRKNGLQGLKYVALNAPKDSEIHTTHITPAHLIRDTMEKFQAKPHQIEEAIKLYESVKNKDTRLNRSRPQSVSSSIVFCYILIHKKNISLKEFAKRVNLSELTINKMAKIIAEILGFPELFN